MQTPLMKKDSFDTNDFSQQQQRLGHHQRLGLH
jgi:hypothetical protein